MAMSLAGLACLLHTALSMLKIMATPAAIQLNFTSATHHLAQTAITK